MISLCRTHRQHTACVLLLFLFLIGALLVRAIRRAQPGFTEAQSEAIEPGMTEEQVEAILGGPAGDYRASRFTALPEKPFDSQYFIFSTLSAASMSTENTPVKRFGYAAIASAT